MPLKGEENVTSPALWVVVNDWPRLCARGGRKAGGNVNVGWRSVIEAVQRRNYSGWKSSLSVSLAQFWQSIPFKMAYHSPYKAPPHINAPPDQGFLWNIFQRWVFLCCLSACLPACLSLRSAVETTAVVCGAERKRVGLGAAAAAGGGGGDLTARFLSLLLRPLNYFCLTALPRSEISDLSGLRLPPLSGGASWKYYCTTHSNYTSLSRSQYTISRQCHRALLLALNCQRKEATG